MLTRQKKLTERMPATPCSPEMRAAMEKIARERGIALAELQREAVALFLSKIDTNTTVTGSLVSTK